MNKWTYRGALMLALGSGCAALSHELLWTRRMVDVLGAGAESTARVFGCFFLGFSFGAALSIPLTRRLRRPWLAVAWVELGVAVATLPALTLPLWTRSIWPSLGPDRLLSWVGPAVKLGLSFGVVVPPAVLVGMALPCLARAVLREDRKLARQGIRLYAMDAAGGVLGLLLTAGLVLDWVGLTGSMAWALCLNLLVAAGCLVLHRADRSGGSVPASAGRRTSGGGGKRRGAKAAAADRPGGLAVPVILAFLSGMGVLAIEVLALHALQNVVCLSLHSTAALLGTVILILAVSAWLTPMLVARCGSPDRLLPVVLALTAVATVVAPLLFFRATGDMYYLSEGSTLMSFIARTSGTMITAVGPCLLLGGLVLPLVFSWSGAEGFDPYGRRWGWLLAANGLGGLAGAETANALLTPVLGIHMALGAVAILYAVAALALVVVRQGGLRWNWISGLATAVLMLTAAVTSFALAELPQVNRIFGRTVEVRSGREGVVAVTEGKTFGGAIVMSNQYILGGTRAFHDQRRQMLLPLMLHPRPRRVVCLGMATGITSGAALDCDQVESLTAVEISPLVAELAVKYFAEFNGDLANDPRAAVVVEDARTWIAASAGQYDLVVGDLYMPWNSGVGRLYSLEHFRAVRRALRPGGLFCQWLPVFQLNAEQFEVILATFAKAFPQVHLARRSFLPTDPVIGLLGFRDGDVDWDGLASRCRQLRAVGKIKDPSIRHVEAISMLYMGRLLDASASDAPVNTLDNTRVELSASKLRLTNGWQREYLGWQRWSALEEKLAPRIRRRPVAKGSSKSWADLGQMLCRCNYGLETGTPVDLKMLREIRAAVPDSIKYDAGADWSAWRPVWLAQ